MVAMFVLHIAGNTLTQWNKMKDEEVSSYTVYSKQDQKCKTVFIT